MQCREPSIMSRKQDMSVVHYAFTSPLSSGAVRLSLGGHAVTVVVTPFLRTISASCQVMSDDGSSGPYRRSNGHHESRAPRRHDDASTRDSDRLGVLIGEARGCQPRQPGRSGGAVFRQPFPATTLAWGAWRKSAARWRASAASGRKDQKTWKSWTAVGYSSSRASRPAC